MKPVERQYRLYAKWPQMKRFAPVNYRTGRCVRNLIHASLFSEAEAVKVREDMNLEHNRKLGFAWQLREV